MLGKFNKLVLASTLRRGLLRTFAGVCIVLFAAQFSTAGTISLGEAANYALLTSGAGSASAFSFNGPGAINGDVGIANNGTYGFSSPAVINGTMFIGTTVTGSSNITITGGIHSSSTISANLTQAVADATSASATAAALMATGTVPGGSIGNNSSFTGSAGQNVLDVTDLNLTNGNFTINGTSSETFIINVSGKFVINSSSSIVLAGGVTASDVLFNITGTGQDVTINGSTGATESGTILAPSRNISLHDQTLNGSVLGAFGMTFTVQDTSGFTLNGPPTIPPFGGTSTPLPASVWGGLALLTGFDSVRLMRRRAAL